jgi:hypothetical protein
MNMPGLALGLILLIPGIIVADEYPPYYGSYYGPYYYEGWNHSWDDGSFRGEASGYTQSTGDGEGSFSFSMSSKVRGESTGDMDGRSNAYGGNTPPYRYPAPPYPPAERR